MTELTDGQLSALFSQASTFTTWALSLGAGTVAVLVGTTHLSPRERAPRLIYLLFIPAWALIGFTIYLSDQITRSILAGYMTPNEFHEAILLNISDHYENMQMSLSAAIGILGIWVILYLLWWIFWRSAEG